MQLKKWMASLFLTLLFLTCPAIGKTTTSEDTISSSSSTNLTPECECAVSQKNKKENPYGISKRPFQWTFAVAMIFQDEAPYLKEWIEFHKLMGAEHFYLYNNLSTDNYFDVLYPYIVSGEVELIEWPHKPESLSEWNAFQCIAYQDALKKAKGKTKWLAILDSDEFLVPVYDDNIIHLLSRYDKKNIGGVLGYWIVFGTSFVKKIPENQLLIENLVLNGGPGKNHYKTIIQPSKVQDILNPHFAVYKKGFEHVAVPQSELQINHYWTRDEWYLFNFKIPRREKWGTSSEISVQWATASNNDTNEGKVILRFVEQLRRLMNYD